jgi:hypothetical protein
MAAGHQHGGRFQLMVSVVGAPERPTVSHDTLALGKHWESTGKVSGNYWESTGKVLGKYWESTGKVLGTGWFGNPRRAVSGRSASSDSH